MTTLEYFKSLATQLSQRKLSESQVADVLRELQSHLQDTGSRPADSFGSPKDYAGQFPAGHSISRGSNVGYLAAGVLVILLGGKLVSSLVFGLTVGLPGTVTYYAATLLVTFALIAWSSTLQRQLPDDMATELRQQR